MRNNQNFCVFKKNSIHALFMSLEILPSRIQKNTNSTPFPADKSRTMRWKEIEEWGIEKKKIKRKKSLTTLFPDGKKQN